MHISWDILYIAALAQDCSNSSALAMELLQSCTKPSIYTLCVMFYLWCWCRVEVLFCIRVPLVTAKQSYFLWSVDKTGQIFLTSDETDYISDSVVHCSTPIAKLPFSAKPLTQSPPGQNGRHIADNIFKCIFMNENLCISIQGCQPLETHFSSKIAMISVFLHQNFMKISVTKVQFQYQNTEIQ